MALYRLSVRRPKQIALLANREANCIGKHLKTNIYYKLSVRSIRMHSVHTEHKWNGFAWMAMNIEFVCGACASPMKQKISIFNSNHIHGRAVSMHFVSFFAVLLKTYQTKIIRPLHRTRLTIHGIINFWFSIWEYFVYDTIRIRTILIIEKKKNDGNIH